MTIIVPFNWPLAILAASLPQALLAGNTVVVKPPPTAPLATAATVALVAQALPPGVLNVVTGADAEIGAALIRTTGCGRCASPAAPVAASGSWRWPRSR